MSQSPISIKINFELRLAAMHRAEKSGYKGLSAYIKGLIRHDILFGANHELPLHIEEEFNQTGIHELDKQLLNKLEPKEKVSKCSLCQPKQHQKTT